MAKRPFPLSKVYGLLEPGPVVLVTTASKGRANIMTQSWHTMLEFEPPLVACVISNRNYSFDALKTTKECVINIPTVELANRSSDAATVPAEWWTSSGISASRQWPRHMSRRH